jgi:hypothetical protein
MFVVHLFASLISKNAELNWMKFDTADLNWSLLVEFISYFYITFTIFAWYDNEIELFFFRNGRTYKSCVHATEIKHGSNR